MGRCGDDEKENTFLNFHLSKKAPLKKVLKFYTLVSKRSVRKYA
jgi:hypothetical protein